MTDPFSEEVRAAHEAFLEDALVNLSHELRTPLSAIKGNTTSLLRHERRLTRAQRLDMLAEIAQASERMESLIEHTMQATLALRGTITLAREPVNLVALTNEVVQDYRPDTMLPGLPFALNVHATPTIWADAQWLTRVMVQLLDNARRYAAPTTQATITITATPDVAEWSVTDQGQGIHPDELPLIFRPFHRVERHLTRESSGLGLGLALCERIITLHGGKIAVTSIPDTGSRFWFTLPVLGTPDSPTSSVAQ